MGLRCVMLTGESLYCSPDSGGGGNGKSYTLLIFFDTTVNCYVTMFAYFHVPIFHYGTSSGESLPTLSWAKIFCVR